MGAGTKWHRLRMCELEDMAGVLQKILSIICHTSMHKSKAVKTRRGRTARHHSRGSGRPSHQAWLLAAVVPATVTNGKCLEEVAVKILKLDHHASAAACPIY